MLTRDESVGEVEGRIAALTTDSRNQWCLNRRRFFLENAINRTSLAVIESATFCLILDATNYNNDLVGILLKLHACSVWYLLFLTCMHACIHALIHINIYLL